MAVSTFVFQIIGTQFFHANNYLVIIIHRIVDKTYSVI